MLDDPMDGPRHPLACAFRAVRGDLKHFRALLHDGRRIDLRMNTSPTTRWRWDVEAHHPQELWLGPFGFAPTREQAERDALTQIDAQISDWCAICGSPTCTCEPARATPRKRKSA